MSIKKEVFKKHTFYTIKNNCGLEITFSSFGASIYSIKYRNKYITYHEEDKNIFLNSNKFSGKTLGRVAGRIEGGLLKIGGKIYHLEQNEKKNTLHSGKRSLSFRDFETSTSENEQAINVVFKYTSKDKECGFPHEVRFIVVYSLMKEENKFSIHYHANVDGLTPISLAPHIYWRLGGKNVLNHSLMIKASYIAKENQELINKGKEKVKKIYNFLTFKKIGKDILKVVKDNPRANGYDCTFILDKTNNPQIVLKNGGIKLSIKTDMEATQVYTNCFNGLNKILGYGKDIKYGAIAIEPQMYEPTSRAKLINQDRPFDHYISFHLEDY